MRKLTPDDRFCLAVFGLFLAAGELAALAIALYGPTGLIPKHFRGDMTVDAW